ncbi:MAG: Flp family type IVb pilin [Elusimicrobiota bacterium]
MIRKFFKDENAQGMTEYILIIAVIAIAVLGVMGLFGDQISKMFSSFKGKLEDATS